MGILGMDCLRHYCLRLDFVAAKLQFRILTASEMNLGRGFPLSFYQGCFALRDTLVGVKGDRSIIDTGCNFDGVLTPKLFKHWNNQTSRLRVGETRFPVCVLGGDSYTNLDLHGDGDVNLLGLEFLARHLVTLNFPKQTMYLKRTSAAELSQEPSPLAPRDPSDRAGRAFCHLHLSGFIFQWPF